MPSSIQGNSATVGGNASLASENASKSGDTGTRKVDSVPDSGVTREISKEEDPGETRSEVLDGARSAEGKSVIGANNDGSAEAQLNAIMSDDELAKCYKSQAKDTYFNASEHAFTKLQAMMEDVVLDDPKKMAKAFKRALKEVRQDLKCFERDTSDLKVTVTTQNSGPVQLIPFNLKEIDPDLLNELLNKALALTKNAMVQRASDPENIPRETYERIISSSLNKIPPLLQQVDKKAKAAFESGFKLLQLPRVEMYYDASAFRPVEKPQAQSSSPASTSSGRLDIESTGDNVQEEDAEAGVSSDTVATEDSQRQKKTEKAKSAYRKQIGKEGTADDTDQVVAKQALVNDEVKQALEDTPYSTFGSESSQGSEMSVQASTPQVSEVPVPPKLNPEEISLFEGLNREIPLEKMGEQQGSLFKERKLWVYLKRIEKVHIYASDEEGLQRLIPDDELRQAVSSEPESDERHATLTLLPTLGELARRFRAEPLKAVLPTPEARHGESQLTPEDVVIDETELRGDETLEKNEGHRTPDITGVQSPSVSPGFGGFDKWADEREKK